MRQELDILDFRILQQLHSDSRKSASEIARIVGANERTVRKRIDRLVNVGAVRLAAIINPIAFGYVNTVDIFLEVDPAREQQVVERLTKMQEVSYLSFGQGTNDLSVEGRFKDIAEMHDFLRKTLPEIPGIKVTGYALVPRIIRNIDEWMPRSEDFANYTGEELEEHEGEAH